MRRGAAEVASDNAVVIARLTAVLENPALSDLVLLSERDGSKTPAPTLVLASCSKVFLQMLTGSFAEGTVRDGKRSVASSGASTPTRRTIRASFSGEVLSAVVEFAATNDASLLWEGSVELLGELFEAAEYYDMDCLRTKASRHLIARAQAEVPDQACAVLMAVWGRWEADDFGKDTYAFQVAQAALSSMANKGVEALVGCDCLCEEALEKVLALQFVCLDNADLFNTVKKWVSSSKESRTIPGKRLVSSLPLDRFPPSFLATVGKGSGLVSKEQLSEIFQAIALRAETDLGINPSKRGNGKLPFWQGADSVEYSGVFSFGSLYSLGLLDFSLSNGRWEFDILVLDMGQELEVGFIGGSLYDISFTAGSLGDQRNGFAQGCSGVSRHFRLAVSSGPSFGRGDTVRSTISCDTGSFTISVNGGKQFAAFDQMKPSGDVKAFIPAVSMSRGSRVRLVRFCKL